MARSGNSNIVTIFLTLVLAAGIYGAVQFGPIYYRKWQVKSVLSDLTKSRLTDESGQTSVGEKVRQIQEFAKMRIRKLEVKDPGLQVTITATETRVEAAASYREVVKHPWINKTTTLYFRLNAAQNMQR